MADFVPITDQNDPRLKTDFPSSAGGGDCGETGQSSGVESYRPTGPQSNSTTEEDPSSPTGISIEPDVIVDTKKDCTKEDTPTTIAQQQTLAQDPKDEANYSLQKIRAAKQSPNASAALKDLASQMTGGASPGSAPPSNNIITSIFGGASNQNILSEISNLTGTINRLVNFSSLSTPELRQFIQIFSSIPGVQGLEKLPYFIPLSESIGSSITFLTDATQMKNTDWLTNAASGLGVTTPISKLNRSKIHPGVIESVDKVFQDLNKSTDINLNMIYSQYAGFLSMFGGLLGFLPRQVTSILGPVLGIAGQLLGPLQSLGSGGQGASNIVNQAAGFVNQIFSAYAQIAKTAHGLDMIVDVAHHQRVADVQTQMMSMLSSKFGDQLRVLNNHFPVKGGVKVGNSIIDSSIHGYPTKVNLLGDKIIYTRYTNDILNALSEA